VIEVLQLLGLAADLGVRIPEIYIPRSAYDALCAEGEYADAPPCPVSVKDDAGLRSYETDVYPEPEMAINKDHS
jgi:hypothetical protein